MTNAEDASASVAPDSAARPRRVGYTEVAPYIGVPEGTVRCWVSRRSIPHIRLGARTVVFDLDAIDRWLAERSVEPIEQARATSSGLRIVRGEVQG